LDSYTVLLIGLVALPAVVAAFVPVLVLQGIGRSGFAFIYPLVVLALAAIDYFVNWDGIRYPSVWLRYFVDLPWFGFPIFAASAAFAFYRLSREPWRVK
jgi:hypothetical protein